MLTKLEEKALGWLKPTEEAEAVLHGLDSDSVQQVEPAVREIRKSEKLLKRVPGINGACDFLLSHRARDSAYRATYTRSVNLLKEAILNYGLEGNGKFERVARNLLEIYGHDSCTELREKPEIMASLNFVREHIDEQQHEKLYGAHLHHLYGTLKEFARRTTTTSPQ